MFDIIDKTFGNIVLKLESLPISEYKKILFKKPIYTLQQFSFAWYLCSSAKN